MQKHVNFGPRSYARPPSLTRQCLGEPAATRHGAGVAGALLQPAPGRPRADAAGHVRPPRRAATPPRYSQVVHTYPSLVEAIKMKTAEAEMNEYWQFEEPVRLKLPPEPCACRRCASRTLSPARHSNTGLRQSNADLRQSSSSMRRSNVSLRRFRDNIVQFSERGTMTSVTNDAVCEAQGPKEPSGLHRVVNVQRSEVSSVRRSPSTSSSADHSPSILKRPSCVTGLNFIKYQEQPERDLHEAESFPQAQEEYFEEGYLDGFWYPEDTYPMVPYVPDARRERVCKTCSPQLPPGGIPHSHRPGGTRYHRHCGQPCVEEFGFYKTTMLGKPASAPQPWYPVTQGSNVFFKPRQEAARRPRRVLSSDRNIEMYIDKDDVEFMVRRNRFY